MHISGMARLIAYSVLACVLSTAPTRAADDVSDINRLVRQGDTARALQRIDAYLASNPGDVKIRFQKGLLLAGRGSIAEAIVEFSTLIRDYPDIPEPYNNLAVLYASRGEYEKARVALETAIRLNPGYSIAQENLGNVRAKLAGQVQEKSRAPDKSNSGSPAKAEAAGAAAVDAGSRKVESRKAEAPRPAAPASAKSEVVSIAAAPKGKPIENAARPAVPDGAGSAKASSADTADVVAVLKRWAQAWSNKDASAYLAFYAPEFKVPDGEPRARWEAERRARIEKPGKIEVSVLDPKVSATNKNRAEISFLQDYRADTFSARVNKTIVLAQKDGNWLIVEERVVKDSK